MATLTGYKRDSESLFIDKDPEAVLIYTFDWSNWLASGETITTSNWTIDAISGDTDPLTVDSSIIHNNGKQTIITLSGGTEGNIYTVRNTIATDESETERKFFRIVCKQRSF
jgi:hypothetical protein